MLCRRFANKLTKIRHLVCSNSIQDFGTGNKLMERIPRDIKITKELGHNIESKSSEDVDPKPKADLSFVWFKWTSPPIHRFSLRNFKSWNKYNMKLVCKKEQAYDPTRISTLGVNLAAAYFLVEWKANLKFSNSDWLKFERNGSVKLPGRYDPNYIITDIDASGTMICYEGLQNMSPLFDLKWLSFKGCELIDDWCLDKISSHYPNLEYLDVSDCEKVTERGLEALYRLRKLKTLVVTNHSKSAAFELTCFMLEDCNPDLRCKILNSWYSDKSKEEDNKKT